MYFPFLELRGGGKRTACQLQTIYSEVPWILRPLRSLRHCQPKTPLCAE